MGFSQNDAAFVQPNDDVYVDIDSGTSTTYKEAALRFRHGSVTRWQIEKDNVANADLYIRRYNSSGVLQDSPIKINGADGGMTHTCAAQTALTFAGTPSKIISAGSYASKLAHAGNEMITLAATGSTASTFYLGIGSYITVTGEDSWGFPLCTLVESTDTTGVSKLQGMQSMAFLGTVGGSEAAHLKTLGGDATAGMYAGWFKVGANSNCVCDSGSRVAAIWVDNQMSGTVSGEEYGIFATTGASVPDAFIGFETSSSGWSQLFYFDSTMASTQPVVTSGCNVSGAGASEAYLKVLVDTTQYGIPLIAI